MGGTDAHSAFAVEKMGFFFQIDEFKIATERFLCSLYVMS